MNPTPANDRAAWLQGPPAKCSTQPCTCGYAWRLVLLGAPGVGKGTQADSLVRRLHACHLSTGDIFRAAAGPCAHPPGPAMAKALTAMRRGELVSDTTVWEIVRQRGACMRCGGGFILDGFPRTLRQAQVLDQFLKDDGLGLDAVLNYELTEDEIVQRLSGRRTCPSCKGVFHLTYNPPTFDGICDNCGAALVQRQDDQPESIRVRLEAYRRQTAPLIDYYRTHGLLVSVGAAGKPEVVFDRSLRAMRNSIADGVLRGRTPPEAIATLNRDHGLEMYPEPM